MTRSLDTWAEIDLSALLNNVRTLHAHTRTPLMAVVKANGYGHGAWVAAQAAVQGGAAWLGVARAHEALALRQAGVDIPILVMGRTQPEHAAAALAARVDLAVFDAETAHAYAAAAQATGHPAHVHLKVDTGMGRLGVLPAEAVALARTLAGLPGVHVRAVMTHFANADSADLSHARAQLAEFNAVLQALSAAGLRPPLIHAANSAAALALPAARFDLVRPGLALYGLHPSPAVPCPPQVRPVLTWKARVTQVKTLPPGHTVSYGSAYVTPDWEKVAAVSVGYADGFRRVLGNTVLIHGVEAPVRGRVCMDQIVVGVNHLLSVAPGDEVTVLGPGLPAETLAERWGTINYEVTCGLGGRVTRVGV